MCLHFRGIVLGDNVVVHLRTRFCNPALALMVNLVARLDWCRTGLGFLVALIDTHPTTATHNGLILAPQTALHDPCRLLVASFSRLYFFLVSRSSTLVNG